MKKIHVGGGWTENISPFIAFWVIIFSLNKDVLLVIIARASSFVIIEINFFILDPYVLKHFIIVYYILHK